MSPKQGSVRSAGGDGDVAGQLLAIADEDGRFEALSDLVKANPESAAALGSQLLADDDERRRALGADLLGQATSVDGSLGRQAIAVLLPLLDAEQDPGAIESIIIALGHVGDPSATSAIRSRANHDDAGVRCAVAYALPILGLTDESMATLRELSQDLDSDVRDWSTFGLAESDVDDAVIREALFARIDDEDYDTRAEAMYGLAKRGDDRVRDPLRIELERESVGALFEEAAILLGMIEPPAIH